jgi:hypothetical protein
MKVEVVAAFAVVRLNSASALSLGLQDECVGRLSHKHRVTHPGAWLVQNYNKKKKHQL